MRIAFFGSGEFALPTFDSIRMDGHEIVVVVSQPDKIRGRGKDVTPTVIKSAAIEARLPNISPVDVNAPDIVALIKAARADLAYVAAFGQKIGAELLAAFPVGIVNLHGSILPAWRGAAPIQRAVMNGDHETGVTVFRIVEKMDAGPVLMIRRTAIGDIETSDELHDRLARIGCDAVRETIKRLTTDPKAPGQPQDESRATLAPKLKKTDGYISFDVPTAKLAHLICGLWSWPGAMCRFTSADSRRNEQITIARARIKQGRSEATTTQSPGDVTELLNVRTADSELELLEVKPSGGSLMQWRDYVNGRHVKPGDRFVQIESA